MAELSEFTKQLRTAIKDAGHLVIHRDFVSEFLAGILPDLVASARAEGSSTIVVTDSLGTEHTISIPTKAPAAVSSSRSPQ